MREILSTITSKGQVTIPAEVRQRLNLRQGDKVTFVLDEADGQEQQNVLLRRTGSVVGATAGMLRSTTPPLGAEALREAAEDAIADTSRERLDLRIGQGSKEHPKGMSRQGGQGGQGRHRSRNRQEGPER